MNSLLWHFVIGKVLMKSIPLYEFLHLLYWVGMVIQQLILLLPQILQLNLVQYLSPHHLRYDFHQCLFRLQCYKNTGII